MQGWRRQKAGAPLLTVCSRTTSSGTTRHLNPELTGGNSHHPGSLRTPPWGALASGLSEELAVTGQDAPGLPHYLLPDGFAVQGLSVSTVPSKPLSARSPGLWETGPPAVSGTAAVTSNTPRDAQWIANINRTRSCVQTGSHHEDGVCSPLRLQGGWSPLPLGPA